MKKLNTILFDLDGTLVDTNEIIIQSYQHAFKTVLPDMVVSRQEIIDQIGPTLRQIFSRYTESKETVNRLIDTYREYYTAHEYEFFKLYPGVIDVLKRLDVEGYNLAVVTSKFKAAAWPSIRHYGLDRYIRKFITLDDIVCPKPDKEPILKALAAFDNVDKAIMIGDNMGDIEAAQNAGIYSAGVAWSIKGADYLNQANPDFMLTRMEDVFDIIKHIDEEV